MCLWSVSSNAHTNHCKANQEPGMSVCSGLENECDETVILSPLCSYSAGPPVMNAAGI